MCAGHEVCAEQREADGVSALGGQLQALLKHLLKSTTVETTQTGEKSRIYFTSCWKISDFARATKEPNITRK